MKLTRATPIKIMDGGKSMGLTKTLIRHDQPKKFRISMEKGVKERLRLTGSKRWYDPGSVTHC